MYIHSLYWPNIERFIYWLHVTMSTMENKTAFLSVFGGSPILRVLDFLVGNEDFD